MHHNLQAEEIQRGPKRVKLGIGLVRVSSPGQANVQHGSLEQQRHMLMRWAERQGEKAGCEYKIQRVIEEDISGRHDSMHKRTGLHEARIAIRNGKVDFFVIEKLDRLSRDKIGNQLFIEAANENGVEVHEVESGLINLKDRGNRLGFNIKNIMAEEYSLDLEEKVTKKQREARVNNGKDTATFPVLGLDPHPTKTGMFVINEKEKQIVEDVFTQFCILGGSLKATAGYCDRKGYQTKVRYTKQKVDKNGNIIPPRKVGGARFDITNVRYLLTNPKYRGYHYFKDTWNQFTKLQDPNGYVRWEYAHGPVIDLELFRTVQGLLKQNEIKDIRSPKGDTGKVYLLSGILQTPDGVFFHGSAAKGGSNLYYEHKETRRRIVKERIEEAVCDRLKQYLSDSATLREVINLSLKNRLLGLPMIEDEIKEARTKIAKLEGTLGGFSEAIREAAAKNPAKLPEICALILDEKKWAETDLALAKTGLEDLLQKKERITTEFKEKTILDYLTLGLERFEERSDLQKKQILQGIVRRVVLHPEGRLELTIDPDPGRCHIPEKKVRIGEEWRGGRDSNPRLFFTQCDQAVTIITIA